MKEVWKNVIGYEGLYQVSNLGRVRSLDRISRNRFSDKVLKKGKILLQYIDKKNKPCVGLYINNRGINRRVCTLVAEAFLGLRPEGLLCCHKDGNPQNNIPKNLRWDTAKSNSQDMIKHGNSCRGEKNGHAKLVKEQVLEIKKKYNTGRYTQQQLGDEYGVLQSSISSIIKGVNWFWL